MPQASHRLLAGMTSCDPLTSLHCIPESAKRAKFVKREPLSRGLSLKLEEKFAYEAIREGLSHLRGSRYKKFQEITSTFPVLKTGDYKKGPPL